MIPGVSQVADARDTYKAGSDFFNDPSWENAGTLGLAGIGWVPMLGDGIKSGLKLSKQIVTNSDGAIARSIKSATKNGEKTVDNIKKKLTRTSEGTREATTDVVKSELDSIEGVRQYKGGAYKDIEKTGRRWSRCPPYACKINN